MRTQLSSACFAFFAFLTSAPAFADYPIMSHRYLADPGILVHDGRIYLYNSNDDDNAVEGGYSMHSIVLVSTVDLKNWTDHGIVFQVPADASWANDSWAPFMLERDGTIYLYFGNNANGVGVATSKTPTGEFKDGKSGGLVTSSTPGATGTSSWLFDPGGIIDDDGQAYLAFGGNGESNARIIKLGSDLVSVSGSAQALSPKGFFEASFMFKRNGKYYYAYSSDSNNGLRIDYLMSDSPMSGYTYAGTIADQPPINNNNNHASEFEFNGKWYHAYHNRTVATDAGISTTYRRNLAMEVLEFNSDDTVKKVTYTTDGLVQIGHLDPYTRVEGETMNAESGIETETCMAGGMDLTALDNGDWIKLRGVDFGTKGATSFSASVASTKTGGAIEVRLESSTGMLVATCSVPSTGGAQTFMTTTCDVTGATGVHDLALKFTGSGTGMFNLDYWQFTGGDGGTGGMGGAAGGGGSAGSGMTTGGSAGSGDMAGGSSGGGATGGAGAATGGNGGSAQGGDGGTGGSALGGAGATVSSGGSSGTSASAGRGGAGGTQASGAGMPGAGGGMPSTGGASGAAAGSAGSPGAAGDSGSPSGCGCRTAGSTQSEGLWVISLGVVGAFLRRRRRFQARPNPLL